MHLFGSDFSDYPNLPNISPDHNLSKDFRAKMKESAREMYWQSLHATISVLIESGKKVYIIYPTPEIMVDFSKAITPVSIFNPKPLFDLNQAITLDFYNRRNEYILNKLNSLNYNENLIAIKPSEVFCNSHYCDVVRQNKAIYRDDDHLTQFGAELLINAININYQSAELNQTNNNKR